MQVRSKYKCSVCGQVAHFSSTCHPALDGLATQFNRVERETVSSSWVCNLPGAVPLESIDSPVVEIARLLVMNLSLNKFCFTTGPPALSLRDYLHVRHTPFPRL